MTDTTLLKASDFLDSDEPLLSFMIGNIYNALSNRANHLAGEYGITIRQLLIISYLLRHENDVITQKTLEDHMHLSNPTISVLIQNMMKKGYITREKIPEDGRKYRLRLTETVRAIIEPCCTALLDDDGKIYSVFTPEENQQLMGLLQKLEKSLGFSSLG